MNDQTWQDLDLDQLFARINLAAGLPGSQVLYHQMRTYEHDANLAERIRQQEIFRADPALGKKYQALLARLGTTDCDGIAPLLLSPFPPIPPFAPLLYLSGSFSLLCLAGTPFLHVLLLPAMALMVVNILITLTYGNRVRPYFTTFTRLFTLLAVSEKLITIPKSCSLPQLDLMRAQLPMVAKLRRRLGWLVLDRKANGDIAEALFGYLNMAFLFDTLVFLQAVGTLRKHQPELVKVFDAVGSLDAAIATAVYLNTLSFFARPVLIADRRLEVAEIYHPLIAEPTCNSLRLERRSALISGPNMAGKTAFIRTVGISLLLAQTLGWAFARSAILPRARVSSAIRREDDLAAGESYFFAEVQQLLEFTRLSAGDVLQVFLVDEIYRGTNTAERVAASTAVLRYLSERQIVLATTHDVELQQLLADSFDMYHFSDQVRDGRYLFDYSIGPGPARARNAIKLLELTGYPASIIQEAESIVIRGS